MPVIIVKFSLFFSFLFFSFLFFSLLRIVGRRVQAGAAYIPRYRTRAYGPGTVTCCDMGHVASTALCLQEELYKLLRAFTRGLVLTHYESVVL